MVIIVGLLVMTLCLGLQVLASVLAAQYVARNRAVETWHGLLVRFAILMVMLMLGNVLQIFIWALLYAWSARSKTWRRRVLLGRDLHLARLRRPGAQGPHTAARAAAGRQRADDVRISTAIFIAVLQRAITRWSADHPRQDAGNA
jgi:hypothetical protein